MIKNKNENQNGRGNIQHGNNVSQIMIKLMTFTSTFKDYKKYLLYINKTGYLMIDNSVKCTVLFCYDLNKSTFNHKLNDHCY